MQFRNASIVCALLVGGCSLVLDADPIQCSDDAQCGTFDNRPTYACVNHFCEQVRCSADSECRERGSFICESDVCQPAQCLQDDDCSTEGQLCMQGRCGDPVFGCFGQKQPLMSSEPAEVQVKLVVYGEAQPVKNLSVRVCGAVDLACNSPVRATHTYDDTGLLKIRGLENGTRYSIRFSGEDSTGEPLLDAEYYMQRPVVGFTPEADKLEMVPGILVGLLARSAGTDWNPDEGLVIAQTFGCDMKPLAGVSLGDNLAAFPFYITGVASANSTETDSAGVGGFVNMKVGTGGNPLQHKLTFSYSGSPMFSFTVAPRPGVVTFLALYMGDYGTTIDRSKSAPSLR